MRVKHITLYGIIEIFWPSRHRYILLILLLLANKPFKAMSFLPSLIFVKNMITVKGVNYLYDRMFLLIYSGKMSF